MPGALAGDIKRRSVGSCWHYRSSCWLLLTLRTVLLASADITHRPVGSCWHYTSSCWLLLTLRFVLLAPADITCRPVVSCWHYTSSCWLLLTLNIVLLSLLTLNVVLLAPADIKHRPAGSCWHYASSCCLLLTLRFVLLASADITRRPVGSCWHYTRIFLVLRKTRDAVFLILSGLVWRRQVTYCKSFDGVCVRDVNVVWINQEQCRGSMALCPVAKPVLSPQRTHRTRYLICRQWRQQDTWLSFLKPLYSVLHCRCPHW